MKRLILSLYFVSFYVLCLSAQTISIIVVDSDSKEFIPSVFIQTSDASFYTNENGLAEVSYDVKKPLVLSLSKTGYSKTSMTINDIEGLSSYRITMKPTAASNIIILDESQLQEEETNTSVSSLLGASRDQFLSAAAFNFGAVRFRVRGYSNEYSSTYINGLPMKTLHNSRVPFNYWGGLNDVFRNNTTVLGMDHSEFSFGNLNGANNIDVTAGGQRKQTRISYAIANRSYRNRLMATHSTGEMKNGWAFTVSGSRRWAQEGYVEGTFYDGWSYFASAEKKINENNSVSISLFGSPIHRGSGSGSLNEMYDIAGTNFYNPNWGFLDGEKKSARNWKTHEPMLNINHEMKISDKISLNHSIGLITGRSGQSRLDWYNAPDPRPDYYRYLPSFYAEGTPANQNIRSFLEADQANRQLNWDRIFDVNKNNEATLTDVNRNGETVSGLRSLYALKEDRQDLSRAMYNAFARIELNNVSKIHTGLTAQYERTHFFQSLDNLLGGEFWYDVNQFVEREFPNQPDKIQADLNNPNRVVREGDTYGYNYFSNITDVSLWASYLATFPKVDFHIGGQINYTGLSRDGLYQVGAFPDNSLGKSETVAFLAPSIKTGLNYKINGRNYIYANASYQEKAPNFRNTFISPRFRNSIIENPTNEKSWSGELAYLMRSPRFKFKALGYFTQFRDINEVSSFFIDGSSNAFVNFISTGEGRTHLGTEISGEVKITSTISSKFAAGVGQNFIDVRPTVDIVQDNTGIMLVENETIYVKNFRLPGAQSAYTLGLSYNSPKYWYVTVSANYFDNIYLDYNPLRRTVDAVDGLDRSSEFYFDVLRQEQLDPGFTLDFFGGGSRKFGDKYIYLNIGVNNLLNTQTIATGGFEQTRLGTQDNSNTVEDLGTFPSRYFYAYGINYFVNLSYRF